jgi:hypothetical protein
VGRHLAALSPDHAHGPARDRDPRRLGRRPRAPASAFDDDARCRAESAHPEHIWLAAEADAAQTAHEHARREVAHARREREDRLSRVDATGHPFDPAAQLADAERDVAATEQQLAAARARVAQLRVEPALFSQPTGLLTRERDRWRARHDLEGAPSRSTAPPRGGSGLSTRPPVPEPIRRLAQRPDPGVVR